MIDEEIRELDKEIEELADQVTVTEMPPVDWLGRRPQLYCPRCGAELMGGPIVRYQVGGEEDCWLFCPRKAGCGWFLEGREAVYQVRMAWAMCEGLQINYAEGAG